MNGVTEKTRVAESIVACTRGVLACTRGVLACTRGVLACTRGVLACTRGVLACTRRTRIKLSMENITDSKNRRIKKKLFDESYNFCCNPTQTVDFTTTLTGGIFTIVSTTFCTMHCDGSASWPCSTS